MSCTLASICCYYVYSIEYICKVYTMYYILLYILIYFTVYIKNKKSLPVANKMLYSYHKKTLV